MQDDPHRPPSPARRTLMRLAGFAALVGVAYGGTGLLRRLTEPGLEFEPVKGLPGFRWVEGGPISGGSMALIGIGNANSAAEPLARLSNAALCQALFGSAPDTSRVQVAYFTDYRCFYCRTVSPMLTKMEAAGGIQVSWHELPLLGQISVMAARAALAAREQGAYDVFHTRLMGAQAVPNPPYLRELAAEVGIDATRLLQDMNSETIARQLRQSAAVAERFGFIGTPAMVIGRTAILGGVDQRMVERLVTAERDAGQPAVC